MRQFIIPYLIFENALEVANYYKDIFNGVIEYTMFGKDVPNCPEDELEKVMHLELVIQDQYLYLADGLDKPSNQTMLLLDYKNLDEMKVAYNKMVPSSEVVQELHDTFWGAVFGVLKDKYGMKWEFHFMKPKIKA
ncbi:VOC family protein [Mycoplasmatota bacterium WC30]